MEVEEKEEGKQKNRFPKVPVPEVSFKIYLIFIRDTYGNKGKNI